MNMNGPLPQNIEAEQAVLGAILIDGDVLNQVVEILDDNDFYRESHKKIFREMIEFDRENNPIDVFTIYNYLKGKGQLLEEVGESSYLTYLTELVPSVENVSYYARLVKEKSNDRKLAIKSIEVATELQSDKPNKRTATELLDGFHKLEEEIIENNLDTKLQLTSLSEQENPGEREWLLNKAIPLNFPSLIYADGGQGKSYLGLLLGTQAALGSKSFANLKFQDKESKVLILDFELDINEITRRAYQIANGLDLLKPPQNLFYKALSISLPKFLPTLKQIIKKHKIDFLIIDSLGAGGLDPEKPMSVIEMLTEIKNLGITSLLIDHQSKMQSQDNYNSKTPFGSVYKTNLVRSVFQLSPIKKIERGVSLMLNHKKSNFGPLIDDIVFDMTFEFDKVLFTKSESLSPEEEDMKAIWEVMQENISNGTENYLSSLMESCRKLGIGKDKLRKLLGKGEGHCWDKSPRNKQGGGFNYEPSEKFTSLRPIYISENSKTSLNADSNNGWDTESEQFIEEVENL